MNGYTTYRGPRTRRAKIRNLPSQDFEYPCIGQRIRDQVCSECLHYSTCHVGANLSVKDFNKILVENERKTIATICSEKKFGQLLNVVYPYRKEPAKGNELRYSLRSLAQNFIGPAHVWVIGHTPEDRPEWLKESSVCKFIIVPRKGGKERGILEAFRWACENLDEKFLICNDDIYFTNKVSILDFKWRHFIEIYNKPPHAKSEHQWIRLKNEVISENMKADPDNWPYYDFGTHVPYIVYCKDGLQHLEDMTSATKFETSYQNYRKNIDPIRFVKELNFLRLHENHAKAMWPEELKRYCVTNHVNNAFRRIENALIRMFPEKSFFECDDIFRFPKKIKIITVCDKSYTQKYPGIIELVAENRKKWAQQTGNYSHVAIRNPEKDQTGHWAKINELIGQIDGSDADWFLWMDADVIITKHDWMPPREWFLSETNMLIQHEKNTSRFINTGVFLIRNTQEMRQLLYLLLERRDLYKKKYHEQEALRDLILSGNELTKNIKMLPWDPKPLCGTRMQSGKFHCNGAPVWKEGDFCKHYMLKRAKPYLLRDFIEQNKRIAAVQNSFMDFNE